MNLIQQSATFAEDFADLLRWIKQCGHLSVIHSVENLSATIQIYVYNCTQILDEATTKEIGQYWKGLSPLNRFSTYSDTLIFERKEAE